MKNKKELPANFDPTKTYALEQALQLLPQLSTSKFVGSVDIDIVFNLSEKQKKESVSGSVTLPHQAGVAKKAIVFCEDKDAKAALAAGATAAGLEDLITKVESGKVQFDIVLATPLAMVKIAKLGKVLGPKGLMPNPTNGTVIQDVEAGMKTFLAGKQGFKMNEQGAIRTKVGRLDMDSAQLTQNVSEFVQAVNNVARKLGAQPFKKITLSPTMGPGVKLELTSLIDSIK